MISAITKEKISAGDVITIDKANGHITRLGRSFSRSKDYDAVSNDVLFLYEYDGRSALCNVPKASCNSARRWFTQYYSIQPLLCRCLSMMWM